MARELTEQQLLDKLHKFFRSYDGEHIQDSTEEKKNFDKELAEIVHDAVKNWGLQKTIDFVDSHPYEFSKYDISIGVRKMSDVKENRFFSWLYESINRKRAQLYKKSAKSLEEKFDIPSERKHGSRTFNDMYVTGDYIMPKRQK